MVKKREHDDHLEITHRCSEENSALSEHLTIGWDKSKIITTNRRYHQRLRLKAWHINSAHAPLNRDDGGLLPDAYLHLVRKKGQLISKHIKGPLVAAIRSPLIKALVRSVETLGLWIVTRLHSNIRDPYSYKHCWTSSWNKTGKKFRPVRDLNPWPLRYRCSAPPNELTSQLGASHYTGSK